MSARPEHHPIFAQFPCYAGPAPAGFDVNFVGTLIRDHLWTGAPKGLPARAVTPSWPAPDNEEYFEWIGLLTAVAEAQGRFAMIELGAGWGRWLVCAAAAVRRYRRLPLWLIGVEAEAAHFRKMAQCCRDNGLGRHDCRLIQAAVHDKDGPVRFATAGDIPNSYGQEVLGDAPDEPWLGRMRRVLRGLLGKRAPGSEQVVPGITLGALLEETPGLIDLIDADIQGSEGRVFEAGAELVDRKVKRVFIGTHPYVTPGVEDTLRGVFRSLRWENVYDFDGAGRRPTPYGEMEFEDGVQVWVNPRLAMARHAA